MMKGFFALGSLLLCSILAQAETPEGSLPAPSTDSFLATDPSPAPAEPKSTTEAPSSPAPTASLAAPKPVDSASVKLPEPSSPSSLSSSLSSANESGKSVYEQIDDYLEKEGNENEVRSSAAMRERIPFEGGRFQIGLDYVPSAFHNYVFNWNGNQTKLSTWGVNFAALMYPYRNPRFGRLGLGLIASANWTKFDGGGNPPKTKHTMDSLGGKIAYEMQYWVGQIVVPFGFYSWERVNQAAYPVDSSGVLTSNPKRFNSSSYGGGLYINLNRLEQSAVERAYFNLGVKKYYLAYTYAQRDKSQGLGASHFFGLRIEF